jgi:hypothetical protein
MTRRAALGTLPVSALRLVPLDRLYLIQTMRAGSVSCYTPRRHDV